MSDVLRVQWTIISRTAPQPWLACSRCGEARRFRSSDRIRVNANGKRVDAWLIYKCTRCDDTWNCPVLERRPVQAIDPEFLMSLRASAADVVRRLAFDVEGLRRSRSRRAVRRRPGDQACVVRGCDVGPPTGNRMRRSRTGGAQGGPAPRQRTRPVATLHPAPGGERSAHRLPPWDPPAAHSARRGAADPCIPE